MTRSCPRDGARSAIGAVGAVQHQARAAIGAKRAASIGPVGHEAGGPDHQRRAVQPARIACSTTRCARACTVLPRPMSSASTPPSPAVRRNCSQASPCGLVRPQGRRRSPQAPATGRDAAVLPQLPWPKRADRRPPRSRWQPGVQGHAILQHRQVGGVPLARGGACRPSAGTTPRQQLQQRRRGWGGIWARTGMVEQAAVGQRQQQRCPRVVVVRVRLRQRSQGQRVGAGARR